MVPAGGGVRSGSAPLDPAGPEKDLTHLLRDNRLQLELLQARIDRLKRDLVRERRRGTMGVEEGDAELALKIARARLGKLRKKLAGEESP